METFRCARRQRGSSCAVRVVEVVLLVACLLLTLCLCQGSPSSSQVATENAANDIKSQALGYDGKDDIITGEPHDSVKNQGQFKPPGEEVVLKFKASDAIHSKASLPEGSTEESVEMDDELQEIAAGKKLFEQGSKHLNSRSPTLKEQGWEMIAKAAKMSNLDAKVKMALARLLGWTLEQDVPAAVAVLEEAANKKGHPEAQMALGFLYATGTHYNSSQAKALVYYTFAALGGNHWAQMAMGYRHWAGVGVLQSCEKALDYYRRVAKTVSEAAALKGGEAIHRIRLQDELEDKTLLANSVNTDVLEYYKLMADNGDVQTQFSLGYLLFQGRSGAPVDQAEAINYFLRAAEANDAQALAYLGKIYLGGNEVGEQDYEKAHSFFSKAASLGNPNGKSGLGYMYLEGLGVEKDYWKALDYFKSAGENVDAQLHLGNMYYHGLGVIPDYKMAIKYFSMASQAGHLLAIYKLAEVHATGTGVLRSCQTAVELYKTVAERGRWSELLMDAHSDYWGHSRSPDHSKAAAKYLLMAELGYEVAQSNSAFLLDRNEVGDLFPGEELQKRAMVYYSRSAAQGNSYARVRLGDFHYYGWATQVDFETAAFHYRIASEDFKNAQAMFNLGYMYEQGHGLPQDIHLAKRFYDMAAETSADAKIPVLLALFKLGLLFALKNLQNRKHIISPETMATIQLYWDIYVAFVLGLILIFVFFIRREFLPQARPNNQNNNVRRRVNDRQNQRSPEASEDSNEPNRSAGNDHPPTDSQNVPQHSGDAQENREPQT